MHFVFELRDTKNGAQVVHLPVVTGAAFEHVNRHLQSTLMHFSGTQWQLRQRHLHRRHFKHLKQKPGVHVRHRPHTPLPPDGTYPHPHEGIVAQVPVYEHERVASSGNAQFPGAGLLLMLQPPSAADSLPNTSPNSLKLLVESGVPPEKRKRCFATAWW
tara:strand:+ start:2321 stop:2797 length:477 start_codon:yes stop_codon:yes gene_type:complete